jgi:hypothetical protein
MVRWVAALVPTLVLGLAAGGVTSEVAGATASAARPDIGAVAGLGSSSTSSTGAPRLGVLPPNNPAANRAPSGSSPLVAIDDARASEGVGPIPIAESTFDALPVTEQIFVIVNLERTGRGLPAFEAMTSQLDSFAQAGANGGADPNYPPALTGGGTIIAGGGIWAGGSASALVADFAWMYEDGWGGSVQATPNSNCTSANAPGCWGHRDDILATYPMCPGQVPTLVMGSAYSPNGFTGGSQAALLIAACGPPPTDEVTNWASVAGSLGLSPPVVGVAPTSDGHGYWLARSDGSIDFFGDAHRFGSMAGQSLNALISHIVVTPDGLGYWLVASDGGTFAFGDAGFFGSMGGRLLNAPIVDMAPTSDGKGYWLVGADGGIFAFGDAAFHGSMGGFPLNRPVVGIAPDNASGGYWEVATDGGIFAFGAPFLGSTGSLSLIEPVNGMAVSADGKGYWFVASDGGLFAFGDAAFHGSMGGQSLNAPIVGMAPDDASGGYWMVASDGGVFCFTAPFYGAGVP